MRDKIEIKIDWFFTPLMIGLAVLLLLSMNHDLVVIDQTLERIANVMEK